MQENLRIDEESVKILVLVVLGGELAGDATILGRALRDWPRRITYIFIFLGLHHFSSRPHNLLLILY